MPKPAGSLENMMRGKMAATSEPAKSEVAKARSTPAAAPTGEANKPPIDKVSLYLPKPVHKYIKQIALDMDRRPHDLLMEGVELLLKQHGKSLKDLTGA